MLCKLTRLLAVAGLIAAAGLAVAAPQADVLVRPNAEVSSKEVTLADLASVRCDDEGLAKRLASATLGLSPLPGRTRTITRDQVIIAMRRQGISDDMTNLVCPEQVSVTRSACVVPGEALFEAAKEYVESQTSWPGTVSVEAVRLPQEQTVAAGDLELRVRPGSHPVKKGRNSLPVEIVVNSQVQTTVYVSVLIRVFSPVLVATQPIARSEEVTGVNTIIEEREITNLPDDVVTQRPETDVTAAMPIAQGAAIRRSWIAEPPIIRSGDKVTVLVSGRYVRVSDKGIAAADGRRGDRVKVRLAGEVREVRGTATEPGLVEIKISRRN
jgi:flagella basal body P-ring formation protein FlgA